MRERTVIVVEASTNLVKEFFYKCSVVDRYEEGMK